MNFLCPRGKYKSLCYCDDNQNHLLSRRYVIRGLIIWWGGVVKLKFSFDLNQSKLQHIHELPQKHHLIVFWFFYWELAFWDHWVQMSESQNFLHFPQKTSKTLPLIVIIQYRVPNQKRRKAKSGYRMELWKAFFIPSILWFFMHKISLTMIN